MSHVALVEAIRAGDEPTVLAMLAMDERLCVDEDEPSALVLALFGGLRQAADTILIRRLHLTPYESAATGNLAQLACSLARDPDAALSFAADGFTALHLACYFGQPEAVSLLLRAGADVAAPAGNAMRLRPLHSAAIAGQVEPCRLLLAAGADPNQALQGGYRPLHAAALRGSMALADLLLAHGARSSLPADDGRTPAALAYQTGHTELGDRLRSHSR